MHKKEGFITIISLLVMSIVLIFSLFLIYISNMEYLILNSSKNNIQAYYSAESKIHMILDMDEYYTLLLPRIIEYLETGRLSKYKDKKIKIDDKHLLTGDKNGTVNLEFNIEDNRRILELSTSSSYNNITNNIISKVYLLNDLYEMGIPILSESSIRTDRLKEYTDYLDDLQKEIKPPTNIKDIIGIDGSNYERIDIITKTNGSKYVEFFRNDIATPVKSEPVGKNKIFLVAKGNDFKPIEVCIFAEESLDKVKLEGTFYIEGGSLQISSNAIIDGILIIDNGCMKIEPLMELEWNGLILFKDYMGKEIDEDYVKVKYDESVIKRTGVYLPGFIDPVIKLIKIQ